MFASLRCIYGHLCVKRRGNGNDDAVDIIPFEQVMIFIACVEPKYIRGAVCGLAQDIRYRQHSGSCHVGVSLGMNLSYSTCSDKTDSHHERFSLLRCKRTGLAYSNLAPLTRRAITGKNDFEGGTPIFTGY